MRLILTGDWQAHESNLDLCAVVVKELLAAAEQYKPDAIVHLGDLKENYSPVSVHVVKFCVHAMAQLTKAGYKVVVLQGNHDRVSQSQDSINWLSVFRTVTSISKLKAIRIGDGYVYGLPYTGDRKQEKIWAHNLYSNMVVDGTPCVLLFHTDLFGAQMNSAGVKSTGAQAGDLHAGDYSAAFGGHLHEYQKLPGQNIWYAGSPFCHGWDEANVTHGFLLADIGRDGKLAVKQLKTSVPGWYTSGYLEENKITPEDGAYIRSQVQVSSKKITAQLTQEEERLKALYPNCRFLVVPKVVQEETGGLVLSGASDKEKLEQYVAATIPEASKFSVKRAVGYLQGRLPAKIGYKARYGKIQALKTRATNVLSFLDVEVNYQKRGLVLIKGINKDVQGRSNGSGKSNLLALTPIGLCGETLKGQKNDAWAYEKNDKPAILHQWFRDGAGRKIEVVRQRRPHRIELYIDGKNQSQGLTGKRKIETQGLIEETTGFDLELLKNSVYIDQTIANGFVFGTQKGRMDLISKLCDLERFDEAQKAVAQDIKDAQKEQGELEIKSDNWQGEIEEIAEELISLGKMASKSWATELEEAKKEVARCRIVYQGLMNNKKFYADMQERVDDWNVDLTVAKTNLKLYASESAKYTGLHSRAAALINQEKCPTCGQPAQKVGRELAKSFKEKMDEANHNFDKWDEACTALGKKLAKDSLALGEYKRNLEKNKTDLLLVEDRQARAQTGVDQERKQSDLIQAKIQKLNARQTVVERLLKAAKHSLLELDKTISMYDYARKAFQRSGIPLYMAGSLCPLLNNAAEEYSGIFFDSALNVRFDIDDGEFVVNILNLTGSEKSEGQSVGESAMAGVVAAFALREAAPKTNLLILDEPGHGLDETGAKQFARGLLKIRNRYDTILLTTHSQVIESELLGEAKIWTVIKKKGISKLCQ